MEHVEELLRQAEQEAGKKHGLDVRDELRLAHQTVQTRALLQTLTHTQAVTLRKKWKYEINIGIDLALHSDLVSSELSTVFCYTT